MVSRCGRVSGRSKKQQEERVQLESRLEVGTRVVLSSGLFVTITHIGDKQAVVELAPGVR
ncbi:translocase subunit [Cutibacterium acnes JCM 18918]|nr:translocase subunit [Cutibacterium acnes JCM 18918]